jgi:hypothetical protein
MKEIGTKTAMSVRVVEMTAKAIWREPRRAASRGGSPSSTRRWMFSSTTMASSTTMPIASTSASSVSTLSEKPIAAITVKEPMIDTGIATVGMMVARTERRKKKITPMTSRMPIPSAWKTS